MNNNIVEFLNSKGKVELSAQVVELSLIDDFVKALDNMILEPYGNIANKVISLRSEIKKNVKDLESILGRVNHVAKIGMDIEKSIKDLGLDLPANYKASKDRLFTQESQIKKAISAWSSSADSLITP